MDSLLMTTGEVAKLCGVTPDAVLKWIKAGKLPATRTPGGHFRVSRDTCSAMGLGKPPQEEPQIAAVNPGDKSGESRCWEFFGVNGTPRDTCLKCVVFLAGAQHCYKLAELGEQTGHTRNFCGKDDCEPCSFYRACHGMTTAVLVVTRDDALTRRLEKEIDFSRITMRVARTGYEASIAIAAFHPSLVVLDSDVPEVRDGQLPESIMRDERVPGVAVYVALREGHEVTVDRESAPTIEAPFAATQIHDLAARLRVRHTA
jgi:excisionase family DNA binding protein